MGITAKIRHTVLIETGSELVNEHLFQNIKGETLNDIETHVSRFMSDFPESYRFINRVIFINDRPLANR